MTFSDGKKFMFVGSAAYEIKAQNFSNKHYLFVQQKREADTSSFLEAHGVVPSKWTLIPKHLHETQMNLMATR